MSTEGVIYRVAGPVVTAVGISPRMYDVVHVGNEKLMGEVIKIVGDKSIIQVYEDTTGVKPGEPVTNTGLPLAVELGPGLLTSVYDGIRLILVLFLEWTILFRYLSYVSTIPFHLRLFGRGSTRLSSSTYC